MQLFHEGGANTSPRLPGFGVETVKFRFSSLAVEVQKANDNAFLLGDEELSVAGCQALIDTVDDSRQ